MHVLRPALLAPCATDGSAFPEGGVEYSPPTCKDNPGLGSMYITMGLDTCLDPGGKGQPKGIRIKNYHPPCPPTGDEAPITPL